MSGEGLQPSIPKSLPVSRDFLLVCAGCWDPCVLVLIDAKAFRFHLMSSSSKLTDYLQTHTVYSPRYYCPIIL